MHARGTQILGVYMFISVPIEVFRKKNCIFTFMFVCRYIYIYINTLCIHVCANTFIHIHTHIMHSCACQYVYIHTLCIHVCVGMIKTIPKLTVGLKNSAVVIPDSNASRRPPKNKATDDTPAEVSKTNKQWKECWKLCNRSLETTKGSTIWVRKVFKTQQRLQETHT